MTFPRFALRDLAIVAIALGAWWLAADHSRDTGPLADFTGFVAGLAVGATGFVLHEWGHLAGALASRSAVRPARRLGTPFIFHFDVRRNSLGQFLATSVGGFAATAAIVAAFHLYLPDDLLASRIARGAALFLAFLGVTLELPLVAVALVRGRAPDAAAAEGPRRARAVAPAARPAEPAGAAPAQQPSV